MYRSGTNSTTRTFIFAARQAIIFTEYFTWLMANNCTIYRLFRRRIYLQRTLTKYMKRFRLARYYWLLQILNVHR